MISTTSLGDRLLGRLEALFSGTISDGIDDHSSQTYTTLMQTAYEDSQKSVGEKTVDVLSQVLPI